ncbi:hypothetical protein [Nocardia testacea]|uniref:IrrE N-terminal-like domain-containing protein n=1 Tax=Nocardia testacea TaxID=248551 RepID=A0ABW7VPR5_9NOCA
MTAVVRKLAGRSSAVVDGAAAGTSKKYRHFTGSIRGGTNDLVGANHRPGNTIGLIAVAAMGGMALQQLIDDAAREDSAEPTAPEDTGPKVESPLDATVLGYADMSPFLREQLKYLEADGWTIGYGEIESLGVTIGGVKKIIIDNDQKNDPLWATAILAHEVGHAYPGSFDAITDPPTPGEKYGPWLERNMRMHYLSEAESGLVTARARSEIMGNGGPDIGNISDETKAIREEERLGNLSHDQARDRLADELSRVPLQHYQDQLEQHWKANYAGTHGPPVVDTGNHGVPITPGNNDHYPPAIVDGTDPGPPIDEEGGNVPAPVDPNSPGNLPNGPS